MEEVVEWEGGGLSVGNCPGVKSKCQQKCSKGYYASGEEENEPDQRDSGKVPSGKHKPYMHGPTGLLRGHYQRQRKERTRCVSLCLLDRQLALCVISGRRPVVSGGLFAADEPLRVQENSLRQ